MQKNSSSTTFGGVAEATSINSSDNNNLAV